MTIALHNGSTAGLFDRLGFLFGRGLDLLSLLGGSSTSNVGSGASLATAKTNAYSYWSASPASPGAIDGFDRDITSFRSATTGFFSALQAHASQTVQDMADADTRLPSKTLANALALLISQMVTAGASVNDSQPAVGSQTAVGSPTGSDTTVVVSVLRGDGLKSQYVLPEVLTVSCTNDAQRGATAGNEPMSVVGQSNSATPFDCAWPQGAGTNVSLNCVNGAANNSAGNKLVNGDFFVYGSTNYPDNWTVLVGAAGTDILNGTSTAVYTTGGGSLKILGDGSTLSSVAQTFNTASSTTAGAGGTPATLLPLRMYCVSFWYKLNAASPAAGVLQVSLVDGSNAIITNAQSVSQASTLALTGVGDTNWHNFTAVFQTPASLPSTVKLRIRLSTALTNTKYVLIGRVAFSEMTQLYAGGPYCSIFSGATNLVNGSGGGATPDTWTLAVTTTWGAFQRELERYFNMRALGLQLPYATGGAETVPDSYIA